MKHLVAIVLLSACASMPRSGPARFVDAAGAWSDDRGAVSVERDRIVTREEGDVIIRGFVREEPDGVWVLRKWGRLERWKASFDGDALILGERHLRRLAAVPEELRIEPMTIGTPAPLSAERVKAIVDELEGRNTREQAALKAQLAEKNETTTAEVKRVEADNLAWLTAIVREVGWIDAERFGRQPSSRATIILKHSGGHALPLVLAALPQIERGIGHSQSFEVFYDSLQLQLGHKQRFGTQLAADANGNPYVLPVEDVEHIEERRAANGDMPWQDYLAAASKMLYGGKPIKLTPPEE